MIMSTTICLTIFYAFCIKILSGFCHSPVDFCTHSDTSASTLLHVLCMDIHRRMTKAGSPSNLYDMLSVIGW